MVAFALRERYPFPPRNPGDTTMNRILLIIKAPETASLDYDNGFAAMIASRNHVGAIEVQGRTDNGNGNEIIATTSVANLPAVINWFHSDAALPLGMPRPAGSLLFWNRIDTH